MDLKFPHVGSENSDPLIMLLLEPDTYTGLDRPHPCLQQLQETFKDNQVILIKSQRTHGRRWHKFMHCW